MVKIKARNASIVADYITASTLSTADKKLLDKFKARLIVQDGMVVEPFTEKLEIGYDKKSELENYAMSEILESLPQKIQNDYQNIWDEFLSRETPESKLVYELDKLEMALQAKIYEKDVDPEKVKPFIISAVEQIIDPDVKKVLMDILK